MQDAGYTKYECYSPHPVHGIDQAMKTPYSPIPWLVLGGGLAGMAGAILMQCWMNGIDYPYLISGKPLFSIPAQMPVAFELTILLAGITAFVGMIGLNKLFVYYSPLNKSKVMTRVTNDKYALVVEASDANFRLDATSAMLTAAGLIDELDLTIGPLLVGLDNSVQIVNRFDDELQFIAAGSETARHAAKIALADLFRPGMLGVIADAACMAVVALSPIPMLQKLTVLAVVWVSTLTVSAVILTPVLLSYLRKPHGHVHPINMEPLARKVLDAAVWVATSPFRYVTIAASALIIVVFGVYAFNLKIGDANPGSPILWPESTYNQDAAAINKRFQGVDRMFIVVGEDGKDDILKTNEVLLTMNRFQRFIEAQPEVGGSISLADVLPVVNATLHEGNPRYLELGDSQQVNGSLVAILDSISEPGDIDRFSDNKYANGAITMMFRDRQGETIRTAVARIKEFIEKNPLAQGHWQLAGGVIGVMAAVNEVILSGQIEAVALALLVLVIICTIVYRSTVAGMLFMIPVIISNTLTFAFMAWKDIGMNINTVPVAALGIGLGVDYAFYIADRVKEEIAIGSSPQHAIHQALHSAGMGVFVTASVLILSTLLWWVSSLKFQAEMGLLMAIWLGVSAISALFVMPAIIYVFRPEFIFGRQDKPVLQELRGSPVPR